jgi:hypothetical protein
MSDSAPVENTSSEPLPAPRKRPPTWGILLFLVLLAGLVLVNQVISTGGQPVQWIENDLDAALKKATAEHRTVVLYLYNKSEQIHKRNELQVFTQRWAREPLEQAVCVRVDMEHDSALGAKYGYDGVPLFVVLGSDGRKVSQARGAVDENQFRTYITEILKLKREDRRTQ